MSLSKKVWQILLEATTPCEPLVMGAWRHIKLHIDAHRLEVGSHLLRTEVLLASATHEKVLNLLVKLVGILEHTVETGLHVDAKEGTAEGAEIGKLVEMRKNNVECLKASP